MSCLSSAELIYFLAALVPVTVSYALSTWSTSRTLVPFILHPVNHLILFPEEYPDIVMTARLDDNETLSVSCTVKHHDPSQINSIAIGATRGSGMSRLFAPWGGGGGGGD